MSNLIPNTNTVPCGGEDNEADGCQQMFPRATTVLCRKCKKLSDASLSEADRMRIMDMIQCDECGVFGSRVTNPCGTCLAKARKEQNNNNPDRDIAKDLRRESIQSRIGRERQNIPSSVVHSHTPGATTPLTELENARNIISKATWTICYEVRTSLDNAKSINKALGSGSLTLSGDQTMPEVLESLTYQISPQWTKRLGHLHELHTSDCELQFRDNKPFKRGTENLTIQKLYEQYSKGADRAFLLADHKGTAKLTKGSYLCLEVFINVENYIARTGEGKSDDDEEAIISIPRRGWKSRSGGARGGAWGGVSERVSKRPRTEGPLQSEFIDNDLESTLPSVTTLPSSKITFTKTTCVVDDTTRMPNLTIHSEVEHGVLSTKPITLSAADKGKSKDVFKLNIGNIAYVAKKLRAADHGDHAVLTFELACVKRLASFVKEFFEQVHREGTEVEEFTVTEVFIMTLESISDDGKSIHKPGTAFLVEPLRTSTATIKLTGTLTNREAMGRREAGVMAFAHWVLQSTACKFVFADLQANINIENEAAVLTLFDLQSHSLSAKSGTGDHGSDGIKAFLDTHKCTSVCRSLQLYSLQQLRERFDCVLEEHQLQLEREAETPLSADEYMEDRELGHDGLQRAPNVITL